MNHLQPLRRASIAVLLIASLAGCDQSPPATAVSPPNSSGEGISWLGIPSAVNYVITSLHEGTGWLLNKSEVSVKKVGDVRAAEEDSSEFVADFQITVHFGEETFETTAKDIPCDELGIPTEESVDRLRSAVEEIKDKMKRLQN